MRRSWLLPPIGLVATIAMLLAVAALGSRTAASASLRPIAAQTRLDYGRDGFGRVRPLSPAFVQDALGAAYHPLAPRSPWAGAPAAAFSLPSRSPTAVRTAFHCVQGRQTDDPLSPPCASGFAGSNGGATYQGVTADEVRVVFYGSDLEYIGTSQLIEDVPGHRYVDLGVPARGPEDIVVRSLRLYQAYFNGRYQTYGRRVRFFLYTGGSDTSAAAMEGDALDNYFTVKPFAAVDISGGLPTAPYTTTMAKVGVLNFGPDPFRDRRFFDQRAGFVWSTTPTLETMADSYSGFVCQRLAPFPAAFAGDPSANGRARKFGLVLLSTPPGTGTPVEPALAAIDERVRSTLPSCGVRVAATHTFPEDAAVSTRELPGYALAAMADFKARGVTTVLWPGGVETNFSRAADVLGYHPEWVLLGDGGNDVNSTAALQDQTVWDRHAWVVTNRVRIGSLTDEPCYRAVNDVSPNPRAADLSFVCDWYPAIRLLFTAIQVAGPYLGPTMVDRGMHALPVVASTSPYVPTCSYVPGDYACVKDAVAEWWSATALTQTAAPVASPLPATQTVPSRGCWMMPAGGRRYLASDWPRSNVTPASASATDPCNPTTGSYVVDTGVPDPSSA